MPPGISLTGKTAIVTGAGRGIGRETALALARAGANLVVNDLAAGPLDALVDEIRAGGGRAVAAVAAIGTAEAAEACIAAAIDAFGDMHVFCANAGILRDNVLWKTTDADFDAVIATHLRGTFTCARAAAVHFRGRPGGGRLILVSSIAGQRGNFGQTAYAAAKAGIAAMARTWSMELARAGVTVNAVVPNAMTAMTETVPALAGLADLARQGKPLPRAVRQEFGLGTAADIAPLFVFLASDAAAGITGQCIGIGGDRLSLWCHPSEAAAAIEEGGWSADGIARRWAEIADHLQDVGVRFDVPQD